MTTTLNGLTTIQDLLSNFDDGNMGTQANAQLLEMLKSTVRSVISDEAASQFGANSKNASIFQHKAPYDNPYQGNRGRLLFVCSAGLLRSPTGAFVGQQRGYNTRACGSNRVYALIDLSADLIDWAHTIFFVHPVNYDEALHTFSGTHYADEIRQKAVVLNIPDNYEAFDPWLIKQYNEVFDQWEAKKGA